MYVLFFFCGSGLFLLLALLEGLFWVLFFIFNLLKPWVGYLHLCKAFFKCAFLYIVVLS